jgi:DNA-binding transcriptional regulator YhcF (GntR family)
LIVEIDAQSPVPPYEQLRAQIATLAASGVLRDGDRLPTIRQLAGDLGLAAGTVARAYTELEAAGVLATHGRRGTFVVEPSRANPTLSASERDRRLSEAADAYALAAHQLGINPTAAIRHAEAALARR